MKKVQNKHKMSRTEKIGCVVALVFLGVTLVLPFLSSFISYLQEGYTVYDTAKDIAERMDYESDPPAKDENIDAVQADLSEYTYLEDTNPAIYKITLDELQRIFKDGDSAVILLSKIDCPYCQAAIIPVDDIARAYAVPVYYYCLSEDISAEDYETLKSLVSKALETDSDGNVTFSIPVLFAVKNGQITASKVGTVDGFVPGLQDGVLTQEQYDELMEDYAAVIQSLNQNGSEATATPDDGVLDEIQLKTPGLVEQRTGTVVQIPDIDYLAGVKEKALDNSAK